MFRLACYNLVRRKTKTFMTIFITLIITNIFVIIWSVYSLTESGIRLSDERMGADVLIYPVTASVDEIELMFTGVEQMVYMDADVIDGKFPMEMVDAVTSQFFVQTKPGAGCCTASKEFRIVGFDPETDFILNPWFEEKEIKRFEKDNLIIGSGIENEFGAQTFVLNNIYTVSGILYPTGTGMDNSVFMDIDAARESGAKSFDSRTFNGKLPEELVTCYLIKLKSEADSDEFIKKVLENGIEANVVSVSAAKKQMQAQIWQLLKILLLFGGAVLVTGGIALFIHFSGFVTKRKSEIGYLRAIGLKKSEIFFMFILETGAAGALGGVTGSIIGVIAAPEIMEYLEMITVFPINSWNQIQILQHVAGGMISALLVCLAAVFIPAVRISAMEPQQAIVRRDL